MSAPHDGGLTRAAIVAGALVAILAVLLPAGPRWGAWAADASLGKVTRMAGVPLWGRFETPVVNPRPYENPFRDVVLNAVFTRPGGGTVAFVGHYDGDGEGGQAGHIWRLRFMPDEVGEWRYACAFSDGAPGTAGAFECVAEGAKPGPLRAEGRWLRFADGTPFYPRGYYFSEAFSAAAPHWQDGIDAYFGERHRFNLCCTTFWQGPLLAERKWNALPYNGFYPLQGSDYTRLDIKGWRHVDEVLARLEARRAVWFNFDGFVPNVGGSMGAQRTDFDCQKVYVRNAVARLAPYWNVTWNIAFEWREFMRPEEVRRLADYVRSLDPWRHLVSVHDQGGFGTARTYAAALGADFVTLQSSEGRCGDALAANRFVRQYLDDRPVYAQEVCWEGPRKLTGEQVRRGAWGVVLGGGFLNYAEQFDQVYGNGEAFPYVAVLFDFIESLPYREMTPRNDLVNEGRLCFARPGERYVCYSSSGGPIEVDLAGVSATLVSEWLDPRTGARRPAGVVQGGRKASFTCPDENDWALHLMRRER